MEGQWMTMKTLPDSGLPSGVYHLADATKAAKNVHPQTFGGQVLHVDQSSVYQLSSKGIVQHNRPFSKKSLLSASVTRCRTVEALARSKAKSVRPRAQSLKAVERTASNGIS